MEVKIPSVNYTGKIREVTIGTGNKAVTIGGQTCFNFHTFECPISHPPLISYEVMDSAPEEWPDVCKKPFQSVLNDPVRWAKKCVEEYSAKLLTISLTSIDPIGMNRSASDIAKIVENLIKEVDVPLLFWGCDNPEKDTETLKLIAEVCDGKNVGIGPVIDKNYKQLGAAGIAYKQVILASSPVDVNLAKQLNILLLELGVPENKIIMDPTTGGLGYGIEYTYSVMERDRIAGLIQQDDKLAFPMICYVGRETWKTKEAGLSSDEFPGMGKQEERGILMEALTAVLLASAGADILVMRHPKAVQLMDGIIEEIMEGK
ncbi:MAG: acetyl-CoA decarbonylase/synthase complex subunit delta [Candidatus Omnitrophica bacterium]|nr:acetyl-CoA decarbonylase/synthase complex subunit delta [Candidatus Omnitrophota bacterium]